MSTISPAPTRPLLNGTTVRFRGEKALHRIRGVAGWRRDGEPARYRIVAYSADDRASDPTIFEAPADGIEVVEPATRRSAPTPQPGTRHAHCHGCRQHIDSLSLRLCPTCGWIRCRCGSCGCNFTRRNY